VTEHPPPDPEVPARRLVLIAGPIASGKSTLADTLAGKLRSGGRAVVVVGLDTVAEMALPTLPDWTWAHEVHGQLVGAWLEKPIHTVIAEGLGPLGRSSRSCVTSARMSASGRC
jgi:energy-coupling factor transporter ATP-binding protein EcfA2